MDKDIPDLAIEVVLSSGGIEDLIKYRSSGATASTQTNRRIRSMVLARSES